MAFDNLYDMNLKYAMDNLVPGMQGLTIARLFTCIENKCYVIRNSDK